MNGEAVNSSSSAPVRSYIPSPERVKLDNDEPLRTYVPSPQGALINNNTDTSAADAALMRADAVEKNVMEVLGIEGKSSLF